MTRLSRRQALAGGLAIAAAPSVSSGAAAPGEAGLAGWREAVLVVPDLRPWIETLTVVGGWEVIARSGPDRSLNMLWSLPDGARVEQALLRNRGETSGFIRLARVRGAPQRRIRPHDQAWETGGISALDLRVLDMDSTRAALEARGWRAPSDPVRYEAYPGVEVIQWAPSSPDGIRLSFIQRLAPPLVGWPELKRWSRAANAAVVVKDMAAPRAFFADALGFAAGGRSRAVGAAGPNVMGLPWAFQQRIATEIEGFRAPGRDGAVELICMPEAQGRDHAAAALPPNLGIAALRFVVADAAASAARLAARGAVVAAPTQPIVVHPYGRCRAFAVRAPEGVWLEFLQVG